MICPSQLWLHPIFHTHTHVAIEIQHPHLCLKIWCTIASLGLKNLVASGLLLSHDDNFLRIAHHLHQCNVHVVTNSTYTMELDPLFIGNPIYLYCSFLVRPLINCSTLLDVHQFDLGPNHTSSVPTHDNNHPCSHVDIVTLLPT